MQNQHNAILIDPKDNVVTVIKPLAKGDTVFYLRNGKMEQLITSGAPIYHKVAAEDIPAGSPVRKYGEIMAVATEFIPKGAHVHSHNVKSACQA